MNYPYESSFRITSPFGERDDPISGEPGVFHSGVDLVGDTKSVLSVTDGTVLKSRMITNHANRTWEWGNYISILTGSGHVIYYCHLAERCVSEGETVRPGQMIGIEGSTGRSTGSHLHFEVRLNNTPVDACAYLGIANTVGYVKNGKSRWSDEAIAWAKTNGIMQGNGNGDMMPEKNCTREETATMLYRMYKLITDRYDKK